MQKIDFPHAIKLGLGAITEWLPGGELQNDEYVVLNPTRSDKNLGSFKVNLTTGRWIENATNDSGYDPVSLYAYLNGLRNGEAALKIIEIYDPTYFPGEIKAAPKLSGWYQLGKGMKNPPELDTSYFWPKLGKEEYRWPLEVLVAGNWQTAMMIVRFRTDDGSKADMPFTIFADGPKREWRMKALLGKYPLYGLRALMEKTNNQVLLTEGQKKASKSQPVLDDWACVGWYGGAKNIGLSNLDPLIGREIWFPFDGDDVGRSVLKMLKELDIKVHPVYPPIGVSKGWDIADGLDEGWTKEDLERHLLDEAPTPGELATNQTTSLSVKAKTWEIPDYLEPVRVSDIFLDRRHGMNGFFVLNETGYLWDKKAKHWEVYPPTQMVEEYIQWCKDPDGELLTVIEAHNMGTDKKGEQIVAHTLIKNSITYLRHHRAPDLVMPKNPFSSNDGIKPYWNFPNGMLEIRTSGITWYPRQDHEELFFMSKFPLGVMGFDYDPTAKEAPLFLSTVNRLLPNGHKNKEGLRFILECFAYSMMPIKKRAYYFICHGGQGSGKSSLVSILREMLGGYYVSKSVRDIFARFGLPNLVGKLVVCDDDIADDYVLPADIKKLSENKDLNIEEKGKPQYQARLNVATWIIGNKPPRVTGSDGHERRAIVMYFNSTEVSDPDHMDKMFGLHPDFPVDERPSILNMVLEVLPEFLKTWTFSMPDWAQENKKDWGQNSNSISSYFAEFSGSGKDTWYNRALVYLHYQEWCELSGMKPVGKNSFYNSLPGEKIRTRRSGRSGNEILCPFELPKMDAIDKATLKQSGFETEPGEREYTDDLPF